MPTASESRAALTLVTGAAVGAVSRLVGTLSGSPEAQRSQLLDLVPSLIAYYADGSSALAADFYDDERDRAGARGRFTAEPVVVDRAEKIGRAIAWAARPLLEPVDTTVLERLAPVVQIETARPYRDTITTNRRRDPAAVGWRRVASGGCAFCRMLADRGAIYRQDSARFASHTNCHCTAAPVFRGQDGPEANVVQYVASQRRPSEKDRARVRAYLAEHYGDH
jgi:hypothetical protein